MSVFVGPIEPLNFDWEKIKLKFKASTAVANQPLQNPEKISNPKPALKKINLVGSPAQTISNPDTASRFRRNPSRPPAVAIPDRNPKRTFTIGSPVRDADTETRDVVADRGLGGFLDACYSCKKRISLKDDVYMYTYRYFGAYCSPKCREKQIMLDKEKEKRSGNPTDYFDMAEIVMRFYKFQRQCNREIGEDADA
eukprot:TRINITY_DN3201_c0_g1_i1.p1 TRINITY_DN3201_c0_g1~~TRINITY_DN3201_c0_g1_i1.p1  ORF type:complete len:196 (+),score=25.53 TRINITY_DN3201_c0_g1_i1:124-711(+)